MNFGLIVRKERWTLSLRGWLFLLAMAVVFAGVVRWRAYPFLAVNYPVQADVLVVEGWISDILLDQAAAEFKRGHYREVLLIQSVYAPGAQYQYLPGSRARDYKSRVLASCGVPIESLGVLSFPSVERDRTYHAALAVKRWFAENGSPVTFNIATEGPHARRSWLMYRKAFRNTAQPGIVSLTDPRYDPKHWWRTSEGVREVLGEAIAYVYARFFFVWFV